LIRAAQGAYDRDMRGSGSGSGFRRRHAPTRAVLCAACHRYFDAHGAATGDAAQCTRCGETVRLDAIHVEKRRVPRSQSGAAAGWAGARRPTRSESRRAMFFVLAVAAVGLGLAAAWTWRGEILEAGRQAQRDARNASTKPR
jgi:hypothetical protein